MSESVRKDKEWYEKISGERKSTLKSSLSLTELERTKTGNMNERIIAPKQQDLVCACDVNFTKIKNIKLSQALGKTFK